MCNLNLSIDENVEFFLKIILTFPSCSCHHELETARLNSLLGNIDANTGDHQVGMSRITSPKCISNRIRNL